MKLFVANWKMNGNQELIGSYIAEINNYIEKNPEKINFIFCPPSLYLEDSKSTADSRIKIACQSIHEKESGSFTGCISAKMLKDKKTDYVVIGHSEDREIRNLNTESLKQTVKTASSEGLDIIFCIGNKLKQFNVEDIINEIKEVKSGLIGDVKFIVAYEPVWAIGSGEIPKIEDIQEVCGKIKNSLSSSQIKVIYGGSVDENNIKNITNSDNVDGVMVGKSSLTTSKTLEMLEKMGN